MARLAALPSATAVVLLAGVPSADGKIAASACPPSCATNELLELLDNYCSDKVRRDARREPLNAVPALPPRRACAWRPCTVHRAHVRPLGQAS